MNKTKLSIWNREFEIPVCFEAYSGEDVSTEQSSSFNAFIGAQEEINASLEKLETYILDHDPDEFESKPIDNIFKYVMPVSIYVSRYFKGEVAILCNYKFDIEHGLAVIFKNGKFKSIGSQDSIL